MRQHLAKLALTVVVSGCSLIYNPNNIDRPPADARIIDMGEVPVDIEIRADASPRDLELTEAFPPTINEGTGTGGSRPAIVVLRGRHFVKDAAAELTVTVDPATAGAATLESFEVSGNGDYIALAITAPIVTDCADGTSVVLDITVSQNDGIGGMVTKMLDDAVSVTCLDELDAAPASADELKPIYSRIAISGPVDFPAATAKAALMRSASSISIGGALDGSADARQPGPGGGLGGGPGGALATGGNGEGVSPGSGGPSGTGGGGGGLVVAGTKGDAQNAGAGGGATGDPWISNYSTNGGGGGGGGGGGATTAGGFGGGSGGTIELTAPGDISVGGAITAAGGSGDTGGLGAGDGGAGTGGVVLIRAGNMLTASSVSVATGAKVGDGGASSDGRVRVDAAKGNYPTGPLSKGPMFVDVPTRTTVQMHIFTLRGTPDDNTATLRVDDKNGIPVAGMMYTPLFGTGGNAAVTAVLKAGYNKVCVWVADGGSARPESINCTEIAYLPL